MKFLCYMLICGTMERNLCLFLAIDMHWHCCPPGFNKYVGLFVSKIMKFCYISNQGYWNSRFYFKEIDFSSQITRQRPDITSIHSNSASNTIKNWWFQINHNKLLPHCQYIKIFNGRNFNPLAKTSNGF